MSCLCSPRLVSFFKAGGDKHRQFILTLIEKNKSLSANQILAHLDISQPTLSHHLKILREAQFINTKKKGKETHYTLNQDFITGCCEDLIKDIS
jgi:ArsR family transcriptional regulator, arsenate/arsenite/antimonite-responsive transcriptional repressor